jgi:hypothetical protein
MMFDSTPAVVFVLMLIAPCAIALIGERKRAKGTASKMREDAANVPATSVPAFTQPPRTNMVPASIAEAYPQQLDAHGQTEGHSLQRLRWVEVATESRTPIGSTDRHAPSPDEQAEAEALLAQAAVAKAHAAALAAAARAAQAKAAQAAELAKLAALEAEIAHRAAKHERDVQAQITAEEHARRASGEHKLPETHPSLDFPRSGRSRRAA